MIFSLISNIHLKQLKTKRLKKAKNIPKKNKKEFKNGFKLIEAVKDFYLNVEFNIETSKSTDKGK